jgi:phosphatidylinositol phospholipase C beta
MKFEPVTLESLRSDKAFAKATKKHQKDLDSMRKRQQKEKATIQKNQVSAVERIVKGKKYNQPH